MKDTGGPFGSRTDMIGRHDIREKIKTAVAGESGTRYAFFIVGAGGVGKTRLLEEVGNIVAELDHKYISLSDIIDLYHPDYHSLGNLRKVIAHNLSEKAVKQPAEGQKFENYFKIRKNYEEMKEKGVGGRTLETLREQLDEKFHSDFSEFAKRYRGVLRFDTLEVLQYESDSVQKVCQIEEMDTTVAQWLAENGPKFPNSVILFAGRPTTKIEEWFEEAFLEEGYQFESLTLGVLDEQESDAYLAAICNQWQRGPELKEIIKPGDEAGDSIRQSMYEITEGKPIYLTLMADLLLSGMPLAEFFVTDEGKALSGEDQGIIGQKLVEYTLKVHDPEITKALYSLIFARKGLDGNLLASLAKWTTSKADEVLGKLRRFAIVKVRPESNELFLHDEVYDLYDRYFIDDRSGHRYRPIAEYYRSQLADLPEQNGVREQREKIMTTLLYYELQVNVENGYFNYYAQWDEDAIRNHDIGLDMRLRDEVLRFFRRYIRKGAPLFNPHVANKIDMDAVDRDCAVRWINRFITRGNYDRAIEIADRIYQSDDPLFKWTEMNDPLFEAALSVARNEALVLSGKMDPKIEENFLKAIHLLEKKSEMNIPKQRKDRILGVAYNQLGYFYRTHGEFGDALEQYKHALLHLKEARTLSEQATTLTNLSFLQALLGHEVLAEYHIARALRIRKTLNVEYPLALTLNALGRIHARKDHPMWGYNACLEANGICERIGEPRGRGLTYLGLGYTLRTRGDQWKIPGNVYSRVQAEEFFADAEHYLFKAVDIFQPEPKGIAPEPIRYWEAYNELGSLYCDWGWLDQQNSDLLKAMDRYNTSIRHQEKALGIAESHKLEYQTNDSFDDLAQVHADRHFLYLELDNPEAAVSDREKAESFLDRIIESIPQDYQLQKGIGFQSAEKPGHAYWQSLAKVHRWKGSWLFQDLELMRKPDEEMLTNAVDHFIRSVAYSQKYSHASLEQLKRMTTFFHYLRVQNASPKWVLGQIENFSRDYNVHLESLIESVGEMLGY